MQKTTWARTVAGALVLLSGGAGVAQAPSSPPVQLRNACGHSDAEFLTCALRINQVELGLGKLATERAITSEVRTMGARMIQAHTEFGQRLSEVGRQIGLSGNTDLSPEEQETLTWLASLAERDFDDSFERTVEAGHVQELAMYRDEVARATSPQLRALALQRIATLEQTVTKAAASQSADW